MEGGLKSGVLLETMVWIDDFHAFFAWVNWTAREKIWWRFCLIDQTLIKDEKKKNHSKTRFPSASLHPLYRKQFT